MTMRPWRTVSIAGGAAILALGIATIIGLPAPVLLLAVGIGWFVVLRNRYGGFLATAAVVTGELLGVIGTLLLTAAVTAPMLLSVEIVFTLAGLVAALLAWRSNRPPIGFKRATAVPVVSALAGGMVWGVTLLAAQVLPNAARISWVMLGDSANNVLLARDILRASGIAVASTANPVPLPAELLAVFTASGRGSVPAAGLLRHDLVALVTLWSLLIVLGTFVVGLTVLAIVRTAGASTTIASLSAGAASLIPLSWFFTGNTVTYGFLDAQLAIPLVLLAFIAYLGMARSPATSLAILFGVATLLLSVWSPLVLIPGALGVVLLVRNRRRIFGLRGVRLVAMAIAFVQLVAFGFGVSLSNLLRFGAALSGGGAVYPFHKWMIVALIVAAAALALLAFRRLSDPVVAGTIALAMASIVGLGLLLFNSRNQATPWTYYPVKFSWLCATVLFVLCVGLAASIVSRWRRSVAQLGGAVLVGAVTVGFLAWVPTSAPSVVAVNPISRIVNGDVYGTGDVVANRILELATPTRSVVLWRTADPNEDAINFWDWQMWANTLQNNDPIRGLAYSDYDHTSVPVLCRIIGALGHSTTVYTAEHGLQAQLDAKCPQHPATVVVSNHY